MNLFLSYQTMKAVAITLFLALCGLATATNLFKRQDSDPCEPSASFLMELVEKCPAVNLQSDTPPNPRDVCNDNCVGRVCDYYESNNAPSLCMLELVEFCRAAGVSVPNSCLDECERISTDFGLELIRDCPALLTNATVQNLCTDNCAGKVCRYYRDENFASRCRSNVARECQLAGAPVPPACGALALITFKGVLIAVLLFTAFFIF